MLKAEINANVLRESMDAISTLVDEAKFKLSDKGISAHAVDPANVAMVSFFLGKDAFISYEVEESEMGIDLVKLTDIFRMASGSEVVSVEIDKERILVKFMDLQYSIALLGPSSIMKEPKKPSIELPAEIVLSGEEFSRAIRAAEKISDHLALGITKDTFYMEARGDVDKVRLELSSDKLISLKPADIRSLYSLDYLRDMNKPISRVSEVCINLGNDYPMRISFSIAEGRGKIEYLLAPRIESD
jgi:proliferating cell nuclear antigen